MLNISVNIFIAALGLLPISAIGLNPCQTVINLENSFSVAQIQRSSYDEFREESMSDEEYAACLRDAPGADFPSQDNCQNEHEQRVELIRATVRDLDNAVVDAGNLLAEERARLAAEGINC